ncbi:hypothetical protein [Clostridium butyricum]|uniref:hypothetical protein n=1 Tax=Clostridium butyricum TaxID=1492 RepID=UPI00374F30EB
MKKYEFINSRVINLKFNEEIFKLIDETRRELKVEVTSNIMIAEKPNQDNFLIKMDFNIADSKFDNFTFHIEIVNVFKIELDNDEDLDAIIENTCIPDCLSRSRKIIKNITEEMKIVPINLPPFSQEAN